MKNQIRRKLRSNQGMTLLLSLLLFLVCAVAGSVVLTAGTATSGTLSERAKLDQRYFSVTSAAELLRDTFDGKSVRVTVRGDTVDDVTIKHGNDWIKYPNARTEEQFVIEQSVYLLDNLVNSPDDDAPKTIDWQEPYVGIITAEQEKRPTPPTSPVYDVYGLTIKVDDEIIDSLKTKVTVDFTPSGLTFQLENDNGNPEKFCLQMEYTGVILEKAGENVTTYYIDWQIGTIRFGN